MSPATRPAVAGLSPVPAHGSNPEGLIADPQDRVVSYAWLADAFELTRAAD